MDAYRSLNHTKWDCKYHVVFISKCRRKTLYGGLRRDLGEVFCQLAKQKESQIEEGHLMSDHLHMTISMPPKYAVSQRRSQQHAPVRAPAGARIRPRAIRDAPHRCP
jgi:putative transposase